MERAAREGVTCQCARFELDDALVRGARACLKCKVENSDDRGRCFLDGNDRVGWLLSKQAIQIMRDIGLVRGSPFKSDRPDIVEDGFAAAVRRASGLASHAIFASNW